MEFKDIVVDNDAIVNTEPKELPKEAHDIPQGVKPHLNPNPGYGEDGKTVPAIKTDLVEGERGTPVDVVTEPRPAFKTVQEVYNFLNGLKIKGKNLEEYIDSQGGVTEEELQAAVADLEEQIGSIPTGGTKLYKHVINDGTNAVVLISTQSTPYNMSELGDRLKRTGSLSTYITDAIFLPFEGFISVKLDVMSGNYVLTSVRASVSGTTVSLQAGISVTLGSETTDTVTEL